MKSIKYLLCFCFFFSNMYSQLYDSFSDGDFTSNPVWSGDTSDWQIVTSSASGINTTGSKTLRLDAQLNIEGIKYISSQRNGSWGTEQSWGFWIGRRSPLTSTNQSIIWLWSSESDLTTNTVDGYRIIIGDNSGDDEIVLERVDDGLATAIITSVDFISNGLSDYGFLIRVTRTNSADWTLFTSVLPITNTSGAISTDEPSSANANINQGSNTDNTYTNFDNGYLGVVCVYTSSYRDAAEFDQIYFDTNASSPLPVELLNFNSKLINNQVELTWQTATEINNYGFEVERCETQDVRFENWEKIGFVNGHGNSNSPRYYTFIDEQPLSGVNCYRLKQIDFNGAFDYSPIAEISLIISLQHFELEQNYPNPFNPATKIKFTIPNIKNVSSHGGQASTLTTLKIYNILGKEVKTILKEIKQPGIYEVEFNGGNFASGVYYYMLKAGDYSQTKKMLLIK